MTKRILMTTWMILAAVAISASANAITLAQIIEPSGRPASKQNDKTLSVTAAPSSPAESKLSVSVAYTTCTGCAGNPVLPGTDITYDIKYQNDGCGDVRATWNTSVPAGTTFVSASVLSNPGDWRVASAPAPGGGGGVNWAGSVDGDKSVTVRLTVKVGTTLPNGFIVSMIASYNASTGDDSFLCGLGGVTVSGSTGNNLTVKVDQPVDESHKLIQPIYQGVIDLLETTNDISSNLRAVNTNVNSLAININNLRSDMFANFGIVNNGLKAGFTSLEGGINTVGNLVNSRFNTLQSDLIGINNNINARFNTLNDNFNARIGLLQTTVTTLASLASQTADSVTVIRGTTISMVSQLNTLQTSANTASAKLDVVNDKADSTLNKIDAATAKVDALQSTANILNTKLDDVLSKLAASQQSALQFQIESALVQGDRYNMASLQIPHSQGGYLEDVRELVDRVLQACRNSSFPPAVLAQAAQELQTGDESLRAKNYKDAYEHYRMAYLHLSVVPGNGRP